jgi:molecular chaperone Hsp33
MSDLTANLGEFDFAGDDNVVPFQVEGLDVRGRAVQLGPMLDTILARHDYPVPVARLLAEAIALTVLLGTSLKFEGKFIVQTQGDGPVDLLVADFSTPDSLRAYARFDEERVQEAIDEGLTSPPDLLGSGILAFTIDQGTHMGRYQGIVEMDGSSLEDIAMVYFRQSEQIPTAVRLSVAELLDRDEAGKPRHRWRAGGLIAQFLPEAPERMRQPDLPGGDGDEGHEIDEDDNWTEARSLVATIDADELTDPQVGAERLLYRPEGFRPLLLFARQDRRRAARAGGRGGRSGLRGWRDHRHLRVLFGGLSLHGGRSRNGARRGVKHKAGR